MRGSAGRALFPALLVLGLLGVVAVASTGRTAAGTNRVRPPAATLLDTILSLGMLAVVAGGVLVVYGLMQRKEIAEQVASGRYRRSTLLGWILFVGAFTAFWYWRFRVWNPPVEQPPIGDVVPTGQAPPPGGDGSTGKGTYEPHIAWIPVGVVLALVAIAVVAWIIAERRRRPAVRERNALAEDVTAVIDDTLDDLRAESDPRRAVIAAYARLERVLAAHGLPRHASETQEEFLTRMLRSLDVPPAPARRLTSLFERARFSPHVVDAAMKDDAIGALEQVRDELSRPIEEPAEPLPEPSA